MGPLQVFNPWNVDILRDQKTGPFWHGAVRACYIDGPEQARYGPVIFIIYTGP